MSELIRVPDIGSGEGEVIELFVKVGDRIEADQSLLTLESDKASMEIPAPKAGVIKSLKVKLGDHLKEGDELLELEAEGAAAAPAPAPAAEQPVHRIPEGAHPIAAAEVKAIAALSAAAAGSPGVPERSSGAKVHAGPAVRQLAREFGVDLTAVPATGPHGRVLKEDVQAYVKAMM
ncbi:biotin/lipoyl-containing protein, partial [Pseudomonas sp. GCM10022186]|uniref:biotin/lipoyl-containing protein n=1 Tax=Pseudomonas sp. GCM10022186 TaxID=3252650 RepID=UPI003614CE43